MKRSRFLSIFLVLALMVSLMPQLGMTAHAATKAPNPVTNLRASRAGKHKVRLEWDTPNGGADGYLIYAQKNGKYGYVGQPTDYRNLFIDENALSDATNYYWVFPYRKDENGNMVVGNCTKFVNARGLCPSVPVQPTSTKDGVKLEWIGSHEADGYLIYGIRPGEKYGYIGMSSGLSYLDTKASSEGWTFYWVFPYFLDEDGKMVPGGCTKYRFGKKLQ